jgi:hypothetical protein
MLLSEVQRTPQVFLLASNGLLGMILSTSTIYNYQNAIPTDALADTEVRI